MTCSWSESRFERFLDGELSRSECVRLADHLATCASCRSLFEELRVVDALLQQPHALDAAPGFTHATMADIRSMPPPAAPRSAVPAYLVSYVVAAWCLIGAAYLLDAGAMHAFGETALDVARTVVVAIGGVAHVASHLGVRGELSSWTTFAGGIVALDVVLAAALLAARRLGGTRVLERQR